MELLAALTDWLSLLAVAISSGGAIYAWITTRSKANGAEIEKLKETMRGQGDRLTALEGELRHMPDSAAAYSLEKSMVELAGRLDVLTERLRPIDSITTRLQEFLLDAARK